MTVSGVAYKAARTAPVATLTKYHFVLLNALRTAFGGSERKRGHASYRSLNKTFRGDSSMDDYISVITRALECKNNNYTMGDNTAAAIILDNAGLDNSQQASTTATASMHTVDGMDAFTAFTTTMRDLWVGDALLTPSPNGTMMVVTYAQDEAYMARRTTPTGLSGRAAACSHRGVMTDPAGCWHCGNTRHVRREGHKLAKETAALTGAPVPGESDPTDAAGNVAHETAHLFLVATFQGGPQLHGNFGEVILDFVAAATIAGAAWVAAYEARLSPAERSAIRSIEAAAVFTFVGGTNQRTDERVTLPMLLGGRRCLFQT